MEYRNLPGTGLQVSRVSLGTLTFGAQTDENTAIRMLHAALDAGVNFIDEADIYAGTQSEQIVGRGLKGKRHLVTLATKVGNFVGDDRARDSGLHRWHVVRGVEACLRRLDTDCIDILYMHTPDYTTPIDETLAAFDALVTQGKINYVGMSNYAAWQVCEAMWKSRLRPSAPPALIQVPYNLLTRSIEEECIAFCREYRVGITVYNPLAGGLLTGKHSQTNGPQQGTRFETNKEYYARYWQDSNFQALESLQAIARDSGKTLIELSLQWLMSQPHVDSVVIGASTLEHFDENLRASDGRLNDDVLRACDDVWARIRGGHFRYNR